MSVLGNLWDVAVFLILAGLHVAAWWGFKGKSARESRISLRDIGARALSTSATAGLIAVSILIPACLLIIGIYLRSPTPLPAGLTDQILRATYWFVFSLVLGLYVLWIIPYRVTSQDVAKSFGAGVVFGPQLFALVVGVVRLLIALHLAINW